MVGAYMDRTDGLGHEVGERGLLFHATGRLCEGLLVKENVTFKVYALVSMKNQSFITQLDAFYNALYVKND